MHAQLTRVQVEVDPHGLPPGDAPGVHVTLMSQTPRGMLPQYFPSEGYVPPQARARHARARLHCPSHRLFLQPFPEAREKQIASIETSGMCGPRLWRLKRFTVSFDALVRLGIGARAKRDT
jgi:hypothetical protein